MRLVLGILLPFVVVSQAIADLPPVYAGAILTTRGKDSKATRNHIQRIPILRMRHESLNENSVYVKPVVDSTTPQAYSHKSNMCKSAKIRRLLRQVSGRVVCSPNWMIQRTITPNDPYYGVQYALPLTNAPLAWEQTQGNSSYLAAVIDSGIAYTHPDLGNSMWINSREVPGNYVDDDANGFVDDVYGFNAITNSGNVADDNNHGSHVAGIIGAQSNNSRGVAGVAWGVRLVAVKILSSIGAGSTANAVKGIAYVNSLKRQGYNVKVINASWGGGAYSQALFDVIDESRQLGIVFVAAAGNSTNNNDASPFYPASYRVGNIISVASVDGRLALSPFSNYGAQSVHVAAPGSYIFSTLRGTSYGYKSGTSMAAPHVAGAVILLQSACSGTLAPEVVKSVLLTSGTYQSGLGGKVASSSVIDLKNAITAAKSRCNEVVAPPTPIVYATATPRATATGGARITPLPSATPIVYHTPTRTPTPNPTKTLIPTPIPTRTSTPTPQAAKVEFSPRYVAPYQTTTLQISNIPLKHSYITVKLVAKDASNRSWSCVGKMVNIITNKTIFLSLPEVSNNFTVIEALIQTPATMMVGRLSITGTTSIGADSTMATQLCNSLESQLM